MNQQASPSHDSPAIPPGVPRIAFAEESQSEASEIMQYVHIVWEKKWLVIFWVIVFLLLGALQLRTATVMYSSTATIKYEPSSMQIVDWSEIGRPTNYVDELKTQVEVIRESLPLRVIESLGIGESKGPEAPKPFSPLTWVLRKLNKVKAAVRPLLVSEQPNDITSEETREQDMVADLLENVTVRQHLETKLIKITVFHQNPRMAARIADEFCDQYILYLGENRSQSYVDARTFLEKETENAKKLLDEKEKSLSEYKGESDERVLEQAMEIGIATMKSLSEEIESTKTELSMFEAEAEGAQDQAVLQHLLMEDKTYQVLVNKQTDLDMKRTSLISEFSSEYPEVARLDREIGALKAQMLELSNNLVKNSSGGATLARLQLIQLNKRLEETRLSVETNKQEMVAYNAIKRESDSQREIYESLLKRFKEIDVSSDIDTKNVTIVSRAPIPRVPSSPNVSRSMAIFGIFGLLIGSGFAFLAHQLDRSVRDPSVVETTMGVPTLGVLPYMPPKGGSIIGRNRRGNVAKITQMDSYSVGTEAFRLLRTSLQYSTAGHSPKIILVTSCFPQEGKSTVCTNLAMTIAGRGDRTLLIDADLKMPTVHTIFKVNKRPGLSDVLTGQNTAESVIVSSGVDNLSILPAGPKTPSPVDLLESEAMAALLDSLRSKYDTILLDAAPLHGMSDSFVLGKKADGLCLVVSLGKTRRDVLTKVVGTLQGMQVRLLGVVYNNQSRTRARKSYGYGYGYGSKYGYGGAADRDDEDGGSKTTNMKPPEPRKFSAG